jgi:hypothetical protein
VPEVDRTIRVVVAIGAACAGAGLGVMAAAFPASRLTVATVGLAAVGILLLIGLRRPPLLAVLGFALLPVVRQEPAPVDLVFAILAVCVVVAYPERVRVKPSVGLALAAFAAASIISVVNASDASRAAHYEAITLYLIATAIALSAIFSRSDVARTCITTYLLGAVVSATAAVLALFVPFPGSHVLLYDSHRVMALFKDPNVFSAFLVPGIAILIDELSNPRLLPWRFQTKLLALCALGAGLLFAFSRAAFLNALIAVATVVAVNTLRTGGARYAMRFLATVVVVGVAGMALLVATHSTGFLESRSHLQAYDQERFANQSQALRDITSHLFGFGPGQVEVNLPLASHSLYARVAYEQGIPGLATLAVLFGLTLFLAIRFAFARSRVGISGGVLLGSWLGLLANSVFIDTLHWRHLWIIGGLIWANFAYSTRSTPQETDSPSSPSPNSSKLRSSLRAAGAAAQKT